MSACILHNLCLMHEEELESFMEETPENTNNFERLPLFANNHNDIAKHLCIMADL